MNILSPIFVPYFVLEKYATDNSIIVPYKENYENIGQYVLGFRIKLLSDQKVESTSSLFNNDWLFMGYDVCDYPKGKNYMNNKKIPYNIYGYTKKFIIINLKKIEKKNESYSTTNTSKHINLMNTQKKKESYINVPESNWNKTEQHGFFMITDGSVKTLNEIFIGNTFYINLYNGQRFSKRILRTFKELKMNVPNSREICQDAGYLDNHGNLFSASHQLLFK